jgi:molybdopterin/thiamine biosynthesis adenylyltransferase
MTLNPRNDPRSDRYSRQAIIPEIGSAGQARIERATVVVVGCGALGSLAAELLARAGVGGLRLIDRDLVEWSNLQRQIGFTEADARDHDPKVLALARRIGAVNSRVRVEPLPVELRSDNALELCAGADLILDGTDNVPSRFLINDVSFALRIPWIYAGVIRAQGMVQVYSGHTPPCFRCTFPDLPRPGSLATCDTAGVLGPAVAVVAGHQGLLALRLLSGEDVVTLAGRQIRLDAWAGSQRASVALADSDCPVCVHGIFEALAGRSEASATALCGRHAVQVRPAQRPNGAAIDLSAIATRLAGRGPLEQRSAFLRLEHDGLIITIFADGRAIFDGLTDEGRARSLYDLLIGE